MQHAKDTLKASAQDVSPTVEVTAVAQLADPLDIIQAQGPAFQAIADGLKHVWDARSSGVINDDLFYLYQMAQRGAYFARALTQKAKAHYALQQLRDPLTTITTAPDFLEDHFTQPLPAVR